MKKSFIIIFQAVMLLFIILIVVIQSYLLFSINDSVNANNYEYLLGVLKGATYEVRNSIEFLEKTSNILVESINTQKFLIAQNEIERGNARIKISDDLWSYRKYSKDILGVVAIDTNNRTYIIFDDVTQKDMEKINENYIEYKNGTYKNGLCMFVNEYELVIYEFKNVSMYNLSMAGISDVGTIVVINKINLIELGLKLSIIDNVIMKISNISDANNAFDISPQNQQTKGKQIEISVNIPEAGWVISCKMPLERITLEYYNIRVVTLILLVLCTVFACVFILLFYKMFTKPMNLIRIYLDSYSLISKKERLLSVGVDEFNTFLIHVNKMFDIIEDDAHKIVQTQERLYEKELEEKNVLLYMYQMQIKPHFFYNTLGCINSFAIEHNVPEIVVITNALTDIFRYSIDSSSESTIEKEIMFVQRYMSILKIRYPGMVELNIDIEDDLLKKNVPRMILQPIVENAFKHGILPRQEKGVISICVYSDELKVYIDITDNGVGMSSEMCKELCESINNYKIIKDSSCNIGLGNVYRRIRLKYGVDYGLSVESSENEYTKVIMNIPK